MKAEFIKRVMQIMNELGWNDTQSDAFVGSDTTKVMGHIEYVFIDAWRKAVNLLPKTYFTIKDFSKQSHVAETAKGTGYISLPNDFFLLFSFKMKRWQAAADKLLESSDELNRVQANEYTRGNIVRPVCVLRNKAINVRVGDSIVPTPTDVLEYYSLPNGRKQEIEEALYIPLIDPLSDETKLNKKLTIPLAYLCASMVFEIFEKPEIAKTLEGQAISIIN